MNTAGGSIGDALTSFDAHQIPPKFFVQPQPGGLLPEYKDVWRLRCRQPHFAGTVDMWSRPIPILRTVMAAAIRERLLLMVTYDGATEPQLFAPVALYVSATNRLMLDGYEVKGGRFAWREVELEALRDVRQAPHIFALDNTVTRLPNSYPKGATVIAQATR